LANKRRKLVRTPVNASWPFAHNSEPCIESTLEPYPIGCPDGCGGHNSLESSATAFQSAGCWWNRL